MKRVRINVGGQNVEAESMSFNMIDDPWSICRLEDGTIFKIKPTISAVFKLPAKDPITGAQQLLVQSIPVVSVEAPETETPLSGKEIQ